MHLGPFRGALACVTAAACDKPRSGRQKLRCAPRFACCNPPSSSAVQRVSESPKSNFTTLRRSCNALHRYAESDEIPPALSGSQVGDGGGSASGPEQGAQKEREVCRRIKPSHAHGNLCPALLHPPKC